MMTIRVSCLGLAALLAFGAESITDPHPKKRAKAARELSSQGSAAIPQLRTLLKDNDLEVREEAVKSIVSIGTQHSVDPLIEATRDNDPGIQIRAVDGIVNFYSPGYLQSGAQRITAAIRSRFDRENRDMIDPFVTVKPEAIDALARLVRGGSSMESRANAARGVGILRGRAALPDLLQALKSKDDALIFESVIAIQKIKDPSAGPGVLFLLRDLNERIQLAVMETVGLLQTREAIPGLQKIYNDPRNARIKRGALSALAMLPDEQNRPLYQAGLADRKDEMLRVAGAEGLGRHKNPADRGLLKKAYDEEEKAQARLALAFALVSLGSMELSAPENADVSPLRFILNSLNSKQRQNIAETYLMELSRASAIRSAVYPALNGATRDEKVGLVRVLAVSGDKYSVQHVEPLTKDTDEIVASEAVRALRTLKGRL